MNKRNGVLIGTMIISIIIALSLVPLNIYTETILDENFDLSLSLNDRESFTFDYLEGGYKVNLTITFLNDLATRVSIYVLDRTALRWEYKVSSSQEGVYNVSEVYTIPIDSIHAVLYEGGNVSITLNIEKKPIMLDITLGVVSVIVSISGLLIFFLIPEKVGRKVKKHWLIISSTLTKPVKNLEKKVDEYKNKKHQKREEEEAKRLQEEQTKEGLASGKMLSCPSCGTVVQVDDENCSGCNLRIDQFELYKKMRNR